MTFSQLSRHSETKGEKQFNSIINETREACVMYRGIKDAVITDGGLGLDGFLGGGNTHACI